MKIPKGLKMKIGRPKVAQLDVGIKTQICRECEEMGRRVCEADGEPALFHRWIDEDKALLKINVFTRQEEQDYLVRRFKAENVLPMGTSAEVVRHTFALVEYPDGSVGKVEPELITFLDRRAE